MSLFKSIFGGNDDKKAPENSTVREHPKEMISMEELYRLEEMNIPEGLELPKKEEQQTVATQAETIQPNVTDNSVVTAQPNGEVVPKATVQPKGVVQINAITQPKGAFAKTFVPRPSVVNAKLTIILVENTTEVAKEEEKLKAMIQKFVKSGYICVINYGTLVRESVIVEAKNFDCDKLIYKTVVGDNACLFDAIDTLEEVVKENYKKTEDLKNKRVRIQSIDVIGIGRCFDNCSITSSEIASESFCRVARYTDVTTKYFCLTEESFIAAATIGFHSIGAIAKNM